jgi:hypothetical protein
MKKPVNQNRKYTPQVIGHHFYMAVNVAMILGALLVIWSFATREYEHPPTPADPITQADFDESLQYLDKKEDAQ